MEPSTAGTGGSAGSGGAGSGGAGGSGGGGGTDPYAGEAGEVIDARDDRAYRWVRVGEQVWFAEDLDFSPTGDRGADAAIGVSKLRNIVWSSSTPAEERFEIGTHYEWEAAMGDDLELALDRSQGRAHVQGLCPDGWRIPAHDDWLQLGDTLDMLAGPFTRNENTWQGMGEGMKSQHGWADGSNGTDAFGLNILPTGFMDEPGSIFNFTRSSNHWASLANADRLGFFASMNAWNHNFSVLVLDKRLRSVRCLLDR